jgi:hypothetical protein
MEEELKKEIIELIKSMENKDSIEIGTPAKGGALKVYGNLDDKEEFEKKLERGVRLTKKFRVLRDEDL